MVKTVICMVLSSLSLEEGSSLFATSPCFSYPRQVSKKNIRYTFHVESTLELKSFQKGLGFSPKFLITHDLSSGTLINLRSLFKLEHNLTSISTIHFLHATPKKTMLRRPPSTRLPQTKNDPFRVPFRLHTKRLSKKQTKVTVPSVTVLNVLLFVTSVFLYFQQKKDEENTTRHLTIQDSSLVPQRSQFENPDN